MIFETTKHDYIFIIGIWISTIVFDLKLCSISHDVTLENSQSAMSDVSNAVYVAIGVYFGITIALLLYDILGKKFDLTRKNLIVYGLRSGTIFSVVLADVVTFIAILPRFLAEISNSGNGFPIWQIVFLQGGFSVCGLISAYSLRNKKILVKDSF